MAVFKTNYAVGNYDDETADFNGAQTGSGHGKLFFQQHECLPLATEDRDFRPDSL